MHARGCTSSHGDSAREVLAEITLLEMNSVTLARALEPFPVTISTLDALHIASLDYLRSQGRKITLASYDDRLVACASAMGFALAEV